MVKTTVSNRTHSGETASKVAGHFRIVSVATAVSRVSGFFRDQLNSWIFGAGLVSDSYFAALRIPNLLRDLFAEGALSSAFIPTLSKSLEKEKVEDTWKLISQVFTLLLLIVGLVVAAGILAAPWIVRVVAPGFLGDPAKFALTVNLTRILFPVLLFVSMAALWMGTLNSHDHFLAPAFAPVAMNLTLIAAGLYLFYWPSMKDADEIQKIHLWTYATTVGFLFQWLIQVPAARGLGGRFRLLWPPTHPGIAEMMFLLAPAVVSLSVTQVDFLLNQIFASFLKTGSITCLNYGNRLMQLPYGVFGVSIATVVLPLMSRQMADGDEKGFSDTLTHAIGAAAFIMIPSTVGLCVISLPVCRLAFEHGHFTEESTQMVADATCFYVAGLFAHAGIKITAQAFYPLRKPKWPFWAAVINMASTALLNLCALLFISDPHQKFLALPLATTVGVFFTFIFLWYGLTRYGVKFEYRFVIKELLKILLASLCMGLAAWWTLRWLDQANLPWGKIWAVFAPISVGAVIYFVLAKLLHCESLSWLISRRKKAA
jgi:putative peptidoglycan lipid II flippase